MPKNRISVAVKLSPENASEKKAAISGPKPNAKLAIALSAKPIAM